MCVNPYTPNVIQCRSCLKFGHRFSNCRGSQRCPRCGLNHPLDQCESEVIKCINCKLNHLATNSEECEEFKKQKRIKELMTLKNYSFREACQAVEYKPYSNAIMAPPPPICSNNPVQFPPLNSSNSSKTFKRKKKSDEITKGSTHNTSHKIFTQKTTKSQSKEIPTKVIYIRETNFSNSSHLSFTS